jgi:formiminoglutamase
MKSLSFCAPVNPHEFCRTLASLGENVRSLHSVMDPSAVGQSSSLINASVILGIPDDRGVLLNKGHKGAAEGPNAFRQSFYRLYDIFLEKAEKSPEKASASIWDAGDIQLADSIEETHERLAQVVEALLRKGVRRVYVVGGGHDFSYGSYRGHALAVDGILPIVNFDAHFDLRPVLENKINSGTAFRRIVDHFSDRISDGRALLEIGIQRDRNPSFLSEYCKEKKISVVEYHALSGIWRRVHDSKETSCLTHVIEHLDDCRRLGWLRGSGSVHLSIDLDVFSSEVAPGTSASTPFGVSLGQVGPSLSYLARLSRCRVVDIAELCPDRDHLSQTARLAATLVYQLFLLREESVPHE